MYTETFPRKIPNHNGHQSYTTHNVNGFSMKIFEPGPEIIILCSWSTQLSMKFIMLINVKMPTIVGILTFISMINTSSESMKARKVLIFQQQLKFYARLS